MSHQKDKVGLGLTVFQKDTPSRTKSIKILFFICFLFIIFVQAFYWIFANSVTPFIFGMPFGMFFMVLCITFEFIMLVALFAYGENKTKTGGAQ